MEYWVSKADDVLIL